MCSGKSFLCCFGDCLNLCVSLKKDPIKSRVMGNKQQVLFFFSFDKMTTTNLEKFSDLLKVVFCFEEFCVMSWCVCVTGGVPATKRINNGFKKKDT